MRTIHKVARSLKQLDDRITIEFPVDAEILSVANQNEMLTFWYKTSESQTKCNKIFRVCGTGHMLENGEKMTFLASVQFAGGSLVFHIFEMD